MKTKFILAILAAAGVLALVGNLTSCKTTPESAARINTLLNTAVAIAEIRGVISPDEAGLIRAADVIVLPSSPAGATSTTDKAGKLADLAVSTALAHGAITSQDAADLRAVNAIVLPPVSEIVLPPVIDSASGK